MSVKFRALQLGVLWALLRARRFGRKENIGHSLAGLDEAICSSVGGKLSQQNEQDGQGTGLGHEDRRKDPQNSTTTIKI